jgi:multidrug efflux pump subunit AcrA (membrane-fusion protein)
MMNRKKIFAMIATFVIILSLVFLFFLRNSKSDRLSIQKGSLVEAVYALGTVKPVDSFVLKFGIAASIRDIFVEEGQSVKKGDPLLVNDSGITFRSPFAGTITKLNVAKNETAMPGIPILEIQNLKEVYVSVSLDQESALRVKPAQHAQLSFESIRGNVYKGEVERIYPSNGQFLVRIAPHELPQGILPDMTTDVAIEVSSKDNVILVPLVAVERGKVVRYRNGKREKMEIRIGAINSEFGELIQGDLLEGDEVLVKK